MGPREAGKWVLMGADSGLEEMLIMCNLTFTPLENSRWAGTSKNLESIRYYKMPSTPSRFIPQSLCRLTGTRLVPAPANLILLFSTPLAITTFDDL